LLMITILRLLLLLILVIFGMMMIVLRGGLGAPFGLLSITTIIIFCLSLSLAATAGCAASATVLIS
jgi:hypothetical protein